MRLAIRRPGLGLLPTAALDMGAHAAPAVRRSPGVPARRAPRERLREIDVLRGLVIVLMALDHVRDYFHAGALRFDPLDPAHTTALLYSTRWITHLCAPTFVFLAGVSAHLQAARGKPMSRLSRFLSTRGLWLIGLELTALSFGWSFSLPYPLFLQVIWAIGWSMIALSGLVWLPRTVVLAVGVAIVAGHNLLDPITPDQLGEAAWLWTLLHEGGPVPTPTSAVGFAAYPILPWIGVMALGYGSGALFESREGREHRILGIGLAMLACFVVLRTFNLYGDSHPWTTQESWLASAMLFLDVTKYPPSLHYVLATLGLVFATWPLLARMPRPVANALLAFGGVPFFFYVLHIYVVHAAAIVTNAAAGRDVAGLYGFFVNATTAPERIAGLGFSLPWVYVAAIVMVAVLHPLCRWWGEVKSTRREWWLSYL